MCTASVGCWSQPLLSVNNTDERSLEHGSGMRAADAGGNVSYRLPCGDLLYSGGGESIDQSNSSRSNSSSTKTSHVYNRREEKEGPVSFCSGEMGCKGG